MPTRWETFPVELKGGLVSNVSRLQQGLKEPGSARLLENFEPSVKGGYRRINGYTKFDSNPIPFYGQVLVQGGSQTGTTLDIANVHSVMADGDTFSIEGVSGVYSIVSSSYNNATKNATLTITPALATSPADKAEVTFITGTSRVEGVYYSSGTNCCFALRGESIWRSTGSGWTLVNVPDYGDTTVNGGSNTGTELAIKDLDSVDYLPQAGDVFQIAGVAKVYTVLSIVSSTGSSATLEISPALATSPANNAVVTFISSSHSGGTKARFTEINFDGTFKVVMVDNQNNPVLMTDTTYKTIVGFSDITGASLVEEFKNHLFFAKGDLVAYSAPFSPEDFDPANGAGSYRLLSTCNGLITFREQLINLSESDIKRLNGSSSADFTLTSITKDVGCVNKDTVQEIGGDILFLGPDGIRFLGATERIGDFNLSLASRKIQPEFDRFITSSADYCSLVIRSKGQYRIFQYVPTRTITNSEGFLATQFLDQNAQSLDWATTKGIKAYRCSSTYLDDQEFVLFVNETDYVYRMESGSTFDGEPILSYLYTPFAAINDPLFRKTAYRVETYIDPEGSVNGTLTLKYDFNKPGKIQPNALTITGGGAFSLYGTAVYGTSSYGGSPDTNIRNQAVGSFFTVSMQYEFEGGDPFTLDTVLLDYSTEDKK